VNVTFIDPTIDWQQGSQRYARNDALTAQVITMDIPMVMHPSDAVNLAANRLWRGYAERQQVEVSLPPSYFHVQENDIIDVPYLGELYSIRITEVGEGNNYLLQFKGLLVGAERADEAVECAARLNTASKTIAIAPLQAAVMDSPALVEEHVDTPGLYITASVNSATATFAGAGIFASQDNENFTQIGSITSPAVAGYATTLLDSAQPGIWDTECELTVELIEGELFSVTEDRVYNGANRMWVGNELLAFKNADLIGPRRYRLYNMLRGLRATPTHLHTGVMEKVFLISPITTQFHTLSGSAVGGTRYFKFVQQGQTLGEVETQAIQSTGANCRQLPPIINTITRDSSNNLTIDWFRRTRSLVPVWSANKPLGAEAEIYDVEFLAGPSGDVLRTKQVSSATVGYAASEQTADGLTAGGPIYVRIYQLSEQVGRGLPAEEFV
jgi:hypothetical protein